MGITFANKTANPSQIDCDGSTKVTVAILAAPDIQTNPADIVLILDRSASMTGAPLSNIQAGAKQFIAAISTATDGASSGTIGAGSQIGIVSFSDTAVTNTQLITSVSTLDAAIDGLTAGGASNHADAFSKAAQLLEPAQGNRKLAFLFSDGNNTTGNNPTTAAAALKNAGVTLYCVGIAGANGLNTGALESWASTPAASYVMIPPTGTPLEEFFSNLAADITKPGATNVVINETINPAFTITSLLPPDKGSANMIDTHTIQWTIPSLGVNESEGAALQFYVQHTAGTPGVKAVNQSITYSDAEGSLVPFPNPTVTVTCDTVVTPEPCPVPYPFTIAGCADSIQIDAGTVALESQGRIVQISVTLQNVCPDKRVALALILSEVTASGDTVPCGMKALVVPAHSQAGCQDVTVNCIKFVLPENLDGASSMCSPRNLQVQAIANYIDTDFACCDSASTQAVPPDCPPCAYSAT